MYELATEMKDIAKGASIADKVIGRGQLYYVAIGYK